MWSSARKLASTLHLQIFNFLIHWARNFPSTPRQVDSGLSECSQNESWYCISHVIFEMHKCASSRLCKKGREETECSRLKVLFLMLSACRPRSPVVTSCLFCSSYRGTTSPAKNISTSTIWTLLTLRWVSKSHMQWGNICNPDFKRMCMLILLAICTKWTCLCSSADGEQRSIQGHGRAGHIV